MPLVDYVIERVTEIRLEAEALAAAEADAMAKAAAELAASALVEGDASPTPRTG
ncbi:MAG: hypothetical protein ACR2JF_14455 [Iamia sp.]